MAVNKLPIGSTLSLAIVRKVSRTFIECDYLNNTGEKSFSCPIPHPYSGQGGGYLIGIEKNSIVLVASGPAQQPFVVAFVPDRQMYFNQEGVGDSLYNNTPFPELEEGELKIKSSLSGTSIGLAPDGNLTLDSGIGDYGSNMEMSASSKTLFFRVDNKCSFTEAGRQIEGIIKRDKNIEEDLIDSETIDLLAGESYDEMLSSIGRSPSDETQDRTTRLVRDFKRNPPLVEKRELIYEYANSSNVRDISFESSAMISTENTEGVENLVKDAGSRAERRTDILNLDMFNFNHLMEKVEGTVVDIYGNVLDINRNIINIPDTDSLDSKNVSKAQKNLQRLYRYMRRSIKYHLEINSRKEISGNEPSRDKISNKGRDHGRWSVDVDGEGLTKINIPASSETGNIPVLGRYITSVSENKDERGSGHYRDDEQVDIKIFPFGSNGQEITNSEYLPRTTNDSTVTAGTAYHELTGIIPLIFSEGKWGKNINPIVNQINNQIASESEDGMVNAQSNSTPNAGGRSVHANLDGSAEISIGADSADGKSLTVDLEGGMVSHFGADNNGRSIIHQTDGDVLIQIGGKDPAGSNKPGRLEIHLNTGSGPSQKIIIDEAGLTVDVQGNAVFSASGDVSIVSGARLLLQGEMNFLHGSADLDVNGTRAVQGMERLIVRNGIPDHM